MFHLRQQPPLFERAFLRAHSLRARQQQCLGFAHLPDSGFDCVSAQLPERGDSFVAVDHQIAVVVVFGDHHDDGRLLSALSQRRQQMALAVRLTDSQVFPSEVELMKLQVHGRAAESDGSPLWGPQPEYAGGRDWSFAEKGEVCRELLSDQRDTGETGLSRCGRLVLP